MSDNASGCIVAIATNGHWIKIFFINIGIATNNLTELRYELNLAYSFISLYVLVKYTHYTYLNNDIANMRPLPILP